MTLHIAKGVELPDEVAAQKNAILAMSGAGKSNTAVVLAEEMHAAGIPWVAIDPKGDWYGVRASADAKKPGLPIPVLGGLHGDVPLEPTGGKLVGNLIAESRLTCVLDVSEFDTRQEQFRFLADLGETLLKANRDPLHLFLEEADEYLPQKMGEKGNLPRCLGAWQRVVKRGRFRGLGTTLISQRSAALNKDVLNQTDTLIAMRVTAPLDLKAVKEWVTSTGRDATELLESLPALEDGEAWIWSPQRLKLVERVHVRRRATYDSGATPLLGQAAAKAATLVDVDLDVLKDQMAETIERAKADDPNELRAQLRDRDVRIRELERDLVNARDAQPAPIVETVEVERLVAVIPDEARTLVGEFMETVRTTVIDAAGDLMTKFEAVAPPTIPTPTPAPVTPSPANRSATQPERRNQADPSTDDVKLGKADRAVLSALIQYGPRNRTVLAFLAGYSQKSSGYANSLGALRSAGLITKSGDPIAATDAGVAFLAGQVDPLPADGRARYELLTARLGKAERAVLQAIIDADPDELTRDELADRAGYSPTSSGYANALGRLRSLELVDGLRASDELMEAIR